MLPHDHHIQNVPEEPILFDAVDTRPGRPQHREIGHVDGSRLERLAQRLLGVVERHTPNLEPFDVASSAKRALHVDAVAEPHEVIPRGVAFAAQIVDVGLVAERLTNVGAGESEERFFDEGQQLLFGNERGSRALAALLVSEASVAALAVSHDRGHRVTASLAANQAAQQRRLRSSWGLHLEVLAAGKQCLVDERGVSVVPHEFPRPGFSKVNTVREDRMDEPPGRERAELRPDPPFVEEARQFAERVARRIKLEHLLNDRGAGWIWDEPPIRTALIAEWRHRSGVASLLDLAFNDRSPLRGDAFELELRDRQHDVQRKLAVGGAGIEPVCDGDELASGLVDPVDERDGVRKAAPETVEGGDNEPFEPSRFDRFYKLDQLFSLCAAAGHVEVFSDVYEFVAVGEAPLFDTFALQGRGEEGVAFSAAHAAYSYVAPKSHSGVQCAIVRDPLGLRTTGDAT